MKSNIKLPLVIEDWKDFIIGGNLKKLKSIIHDNATFYSPVVHSPQKGKEKVLTYLNAAYFVFKGSNFRYTYEHYSSNIGVAEFNCEIDSIHINGIDMIEFDNNLITNFKVFIRPAKAIDIIWKKMSDKLKDKKNG